MKPTEYRSILKRLGLTQSWVGETLAQDGARGRKWGSGVAPISKPVAAILRLIDRGKITPDDVKDATKDEK
jgi:hypothetical protein